MTKEVDSRVVEMRFDNKQFEKGAKESINTLEKLKQALNLSNSAKEFDKINTAVKKTSMDSLVESVAKLEKRFSALGIVGMQTIQNLTNAVTGKLVTGIRFLTNSINEGGKKRAMNIENAHFQLQALLKDEEKVQAVMKNANDSVTGTAYAYDEAAKAASMFAASGLQAGEEMEQALMGVVGVAAMTNSEYSSIADIFTTVAGNGRLMGDQLLQLSSRGLNAAATLADYFNKVNSGAVQASEDVRASIANLTGGLEMSEADIREFVSDGEISFRMFASAMNDAFGESAKKANETFTGAFSNMKSALGRIGAEFYSPLIAQNSEVVLLLNALKDRINDVKKGLTFDKEIGNTNALSKQFTDTVLAMAKATKEFVANVDLDTPIKIFYHGIETIKNLSKGAYAVLKPFGQAVAEVFGPSLAPSNLERLSATLEQFTSKLKMSEKTSNNLKDAFKGVLSVVKLLLTIVVKLTGAVIPLGESANYLGGSFTELLGIFGRVLTKFTEWISKSPAFNKTFEVLGKLIDGVAIGFGLMAQMTVEVGRAIHQIPAVDKIFEKVKSMITFVEKKSPKTFDDSASSVKRFTQALQEVVPQKIDELFANLAEKAERLHNAFNQLDFSTPRAALNALKESVQGLWEVFRNSDGVDTFITNMKEYISTLRDTFKADSLKEHIDKFREKIGGFVEWVHDILAPMIEDLNFGTFVAAGTGVGIVAGILKIAKGVDALKKIATKFEAIPNALAGLKSALAAYERDLNASAIIKVAGAIAILAGALTIMSFADPNRLANAAMALTTVSAVLLIGVTAFASVMNKTKEVTDVANTAVGGIKKVLNNLAKSIKWAAIAKTIKNFVVGLGIIAASIAGLAYMYSKDKGALMEAVEIVKIIGISLLGAMGILMTLAQILPRGAKALGSAAPAILAFSAAIGIVVLSLTQLMKLEMPDDWKMKLAILGGIFVALAGVLVSLGFASRIAGEGKLQALPLIALIPLMTTAVSSLKKLFKIELPNDWETKCKIMAGVFVGLDSVMLALGLSARIAGEGKLQSAPLLAIATVLKVSISSLGKLFKMELPYDYETKYKLMAGLFAELAVVMLSVGLAAKMSKDGLKAGPTIMGIAAFIGAATTSLMIIQTIPWDGLKKGVVALGAVLLALSVSLVAAGQIKTEAAGKAVQAMVQIVTVISGSLVILAIMPWEKLRNAAIVLGAMLLALATDLYAASKIGDQKTWASVLAMVAVVISIAGSLKALAGIPWDQLLAAAGSMSLTLVAMSGAFKIISSSKPDLEKIGLFLLASISTIAVVASLQSLAGYSWDGLLAAGTALSMTMMAYSAAFLIISKSNPDLKAMGAFIAGSASMILIAGSIAILANNPWTSLLAAGHAISEVMLAMSAAMAVCALVGSAAGPAIAGIGLLDLFIIDITAVFAALGYLFKSDDAQALLSGGIDTLVKIADGIGRVVDTLVGGTLEKLSARLPKIADNVSSFMTNLDPFFEGAKRLDDRVIYSVGLLTQTIAMLTATSLVDGIVSLFSGGKSTLVEFGRELAKFGPLLAKFANSVKNIDTETVQAASLSAALMSNVVKNLPRSGSIAEKLIGEKATLSDFGKELADFGPHLASFAESVKDVNPESVEAAANAAGIMARMAKTLPNSGGLAAKIFGDNSLKEFGKELESFGPHIAQFAKDVKDVKPESVEAAANSAKMLTEVAKAIPNEGGFLAKILGDNTLSAFGEGVEDIGKAIKKYYDQIVDIDVAILEASINELRSLINVAKGLDGLNLDAMTGFASALETMGINGINSFIDGFENSLPRLEQAVNAMLQQVSGALERGKSTVHAGGNKVGQDIAMSLANGINQQQSIPIASVQKMSQAVLNKLKAILTVAAFKAIGVAATGGLQAGIVSKQSGVVNAMHTMATASTKTLQTEFAPRKLNEIARNGIEGFVQGIGSKSGFVTSAVYRLSNNVIDTMARAFNVREFEIIGSNAAMGLAWGIEDRIWDITNATIRAARSAIDAANRTLDVNSPSKVFYKIGQYVDEGLANGILRYATLVSRASETMSERTIDATDDILNGLTRISTGMSDSEDFNPTITPTMDLSQIQKDYDTLLAIMNQGINATYARATGISSMVEDPRKVQSLETTSAIQGLSASLNGVERPNGPVYNNVFEIHGEDPETIAQEVSIILQKQVERREAVWGQ